MACTSGTRGERLRRIAERDRQNERDGRRFEVRSLRFSELRILNFELRIALFSHVSRFARHGLWRRRTFSASCESNPRLDIAHQKVAHMDLAGVQRLKCFLPAVSPLHSLTHNSTPNRAAIIFSSGGLVCFGPASDIAPQRRHPHADHSRSSLDHVT